MPQCGDIVPSSLLSTVLSGVLVSGQHHNIRNVIAKSIAMLVKHARTLAGLISFSVHIIWIDSGCFNEDRDQIASFQRSAHSLCADSPLGQEIRKVHV